MTAFQNTDQTPFDLGRQAALSGVGIHSNPYRYGRMQDGGDYVDWEDGWYSERDQMCDSNASAA